MNVVILMLGVALFHTVQAITLDECNNANDDLRSTIGSLEETLVPNVGGRPMYTRWGKKECGNTGHVIYEGTMGGSWYTHAGNGANYLCLPRDPQYANTDTNHRNRGLLYGGEYEISAGAATKNFPYDTPDSDPLQDQDPVCVVCEANAEALLMIPGRTTCYVGWTLEYRGYLATDYYGYKKSQFVCVDEDPKGNAGSIPNKNGALFYSVEGVCGSLPCPPYRNNGEIACVVCVK